MIWFDSAQKENFDIWYEIELKQYENGINFDRKKEQIVSIDLSWLVVHNIIQNLKFILFTMGKNKLNKE